MSFLEFVENRVASADADMITGYAVRSYVTASEADNTDLTPEDRLRIWIAGMILGGINCYLYRGKEMYDKTPYGDLRIVENWKELYNEILKLKFNK